MGQRGRSSRRCTWFLALVLSSCLSSLMPQRLWCSPHSPRKSSALVSGYASTARARPTAQVDRALQASLTSRSQMQMWEPLSPPPAGDRSGDVVAKLLEVGVRSQMRHYGRVQAQVRSHLEQLMQGFVEGVFVSGHDLRTKLGLTARSLVIAAPDTAFIDYGRLLMGRLTLTSPVPGTTEVIFDAWDFGNFMTYPPVVAAMLQLRGGKVQFLKDDVMLDSADGHLSFNVLYEGVRIRCGLTAPEGDAIVKVLSMEDVSGALLDGPSLALNPEEFERDLVEFFRGLRIDLAGVKLNFSAMTFEKDEGKDVVRLRMTTTVHRIPNPFRDKL